MIISYSNPCIKQQVACLSICVTVALVKPICFSFAVKVQVGFYYYTFNLPEDIVKKYPKQLLHFFPFKTKMQSWGSTYHPPPNLLILRPLEAYQLILDTDSKVMLVVSQYVSEYQAHKLFKWLI